MGASVTTNTNKITQGVLQKTYNTCGAGSSSNVVNIDNFKFSCPSACGKDCNFTVGQAASMDAKCVIDNLQSSAAQWASQLDAQAQTGLGFAVSTNVTDTENNIKQYLTNKCGSKSANNTANFNNVDIKSCTAAIVQNASDRQVCQINNTQDIISNIVDKSKGSATGFWGSGWGYFTIGIIVLVALSIIGGAIVAIIKASKSGRTSDYDIYASGEYQDGGFFSLTTTEGASSNFTDGVKKNKSAFILLILGLLFIILILFASRNTSNKGIYLTENDLSDFQSQVKEVQQIAGIRSPQQSPTQSHQASPVQSPWQSESLNSPSNNFVYPPSLPIGDNRVNAGYGQTTLEDYYKPLI